jgi:hypothetical protein
MKNKPRKYLSALITAKNFVRQNFATSKFELDLSI